MGRRAELSAIAGALGDEPVAALVLAGAPGVGKTRLAREAVERLDSSQWRIERVTCTRAAGSVPLGAFAHLLPRLVAVGADALAGSVRDIADDLLARDPSRGLVLWVDDAQWLDAISAIVIDILGRPGVAFVLATIRTGEPMPEPLRAMLREGRGMRLDVGALSLKEVGQLVRGALGTRFDPVSLQRLWEITRGNPLFVRELVEHGLETQAIRRSGGMVRWLGPMSASSHMAEVVDLRLDLLGDQEREALELLALGEPLAVDVVTGISGRAALEELERRGLIAVEVSDAVAEVRLEHPFYGEVVRSRMGDLRRRSVRRRLADAVEATAPEDRAHLLRIATWRMEAADVIDPELLTRAAEEAEALFDHALAERLARTAQRAGHHSFALAYALGRALYWQGRGEEAVLALDDALRLADDDRAVAQTAITLSAALYWTIDAPADAEWLLAETEPQVVDRAQRDEMRGQRAAYVLFSGRPLEALRIVEDVLSQPDVSDMAGIRAYLVLVPALAMVGRMDESTAAFERGMELALGAGHGLRFAPGQLVLGEFISLLWSGDLTAAERLLAGATEAANNVALQVPESQALLGFLGGMALQYRGDLPAAVERLEEAAVLFADADMMGLRVWSLSLLAQVCGQLGDAARGELAMAQAADGPWRAVVVFQADRDVGTAWCTATRGVVSEAAASLQAAADRAGRGGGILLEAIVLHEMTRLGAAGAVADRLAAIAAQVDGRLVPAFALHARADSAGDGDGLLIAADEFDAMGMWLFAAESTAAAAAAFARAGHRQAERTARARVAARLQRCAAARTPLLLHAAAPPELTPREWEIALLAARGLTSGAIAEQLVVSVRTVNNHLARVYDKLGVHRRSDLAPVLGLDPK